jgi:cyclopropane fatty-acyl-phospholipid synthase-like methyltransferase
MNNNDKKRAKELFKNLRDAERRRTCGDEAARLYQQSHMYRFHKTLEICKKLAPDPHIRVLDVGPSYFSHLLAHEYDKVSTLGLDITKDKGGQQDRSATALSLPHIKFELNNSPYPDRWPKISQTFDLIVYAETIEHLPIAPEYTLVFLSSLLAKNGILLITTPNAAMIIKRFILLLKGKNPFQQFRFFSENPGHFREYTMKELIEAAARSRLDVVHTEHINFHRSRFSFYGMLKNLKPTFKDSLVLVFRRIST